MGMNETTLSVTGITCKSCINRINRAVSGLAGVESVDVDMRRGQVRIQHAPLVLAEQLAERLSAAGYPAEPI
jgi:copper chaperone